MIKPLYQFASLLFVAITTTCTAQQDVMLSQPYANQLYLNPAFTGSSDAHRLNANYRYQWGGAFTTGMLSYDQNIVDSANGIGLLAERDYAGKGLTTTTSVLALYAHNFYLGKSFWLSAGMKTGIVSESLNQTLIFPDGTRETISQPATVGDFSAGVLGYGKHYYIGFAVDHIAEPQQNFAPGIDGVLVRKYTLNAGGMINFPDFAISPNILLETTGGIFVTNFGLYLILKNIVQVGAWFKPYDDVAPFVLMAGLQLKNVHIGYSLDVANTSMTPGFGNGYTHEFSLALLLPSKIAHSNKINCPNF
ncbi:MAG TPA: PorP/SprF family type IX secretion system membrane protein [Bacteroidia bacterium]|jgi:type IX secretion system PorP/SprF family membrane protein|nr:PorP/SprF family type IX secretion system membrane protein [Bacteroidia bacterium]